MFELDISNNRIPGTLDLSNLHRLNSFDCSNNKISGLVISNSAFSAPSASANVRYNYLPAPAVITGSAIPWDTGNFRFSPQNEAYLGVSVSGMVRTYKTYSPENETVVKLTQGGQAVFQTTIPGFHSAGALEQVFTIENVLPGIYNLEVTKVAHAKYVVEDIVVGWHDDIDLRKDPRPEVSLIVPPAGDINGDGVVNVNDINIMRSSLNYGRSTHEAQNPLADLNGDGVINALDINILLSAANYGRGTVVIGSGRQEQKE